MYLSGLGLYYLKNGQPASALQVGDTMGFSVPGETRVWLDQYQNGQLQFSGPFNVPMPPYVLQPRDVGTFTASVFKLKQNGTRGDSIGTDQITVAAAAPVPQQTFAPPSINATLAPGYSNPTMTSSGAAILPSGVSTPSAPAPASTSPQILFAPGPALGPETPAGEVEDMTQPAGVGVSPMVLLLALGAGYFLLKGRRA